jgi:hypothetical protein
VPIDVLLEIVNLSESETLKSLSHTLRSLQVPAQRRLFNDFHIYLDANMGEDHPSILHLISKTDGFIRNQRLLSYVSSLRLELSKSDPGPDTVSRPRVFWAIEQIFDSIDQFVALEHLQVVQMHISCTMADKLLAFMASHPLNINFTKCTYPGDEYPFPNGDIKLIEFSLSHALVDNPSQTFLTCLINQSRMNIKKLELPRVELPNTFLLPRLPSLVSLAIANKEAEG